MFFLPSFLSSLLTLPQATATESPQDFPTYHNCVVLAQRQMESSLRSRAEAAFRGLQLASSCMYNCALDSRAPKSVAPGPERPPLPKERTRVFAGAAGLFQKFYENTQLPTIDEREDVILASARLPAKIEEARDWMVFQKPTGLLLAKQSNTDPNFTAFPACCTSISLVCRFKPKRSPTRRPDDGTFVHTRFAVFA